MGFTNLDSAAGLAILNDYLADKSYIEGWNASQADVAVFEALTGAPDATKYVHAARWYSHIKSMSADFAKYESFVYGVHLIIYLLVGCQELRRLPPNTDPPK